MNAKFVKSSEKRELIRKLNTSFGITELPYLLIETGREKIRGFSGSLSKDELLELGRIARIEIIGQYLVKKEEHDELRLSFDATQILSAQITKNIVEISKEQMEFWIRGKDIEYEHPQGFVIVRYKNDFLGCGKSNGRVIFNFVPKERKIRNKSIF